MPGDEGECGTGSGEWIFDPDDGTYQFDAIYDSGQCGYQSNGTYQVEGDSIYFQPSDESGFQEIYGFEDGDLVLCDFPIPRSATTTSPCSEFRRGWTARSFGHGKRASHWRPPIAALSNPRDTAVQLTVWSAGQVHLGEVADPRPLDRCRGR